MKQNIILILTFTFFLGACDILKKRQDKINPIQLEPRKFTSSNLQIIKGSGDWSSTPFQINSPLLKIVCTYKNQTPDSDFVLYLIEQGKSIATHGGLPILIGNDKSKQEATVKVEPGKYYFHIIASNITWQLQAFEKES